MYSKGTPHTQNMWNAMAHRYKWQNGCFIQTSCYDQSIIYKDGNYELIEDSYDNTKGRSLTETEVDEEEKKHEHITEKNSCGFDSDFLTDEISSHYPNFDENNICRCCGYQFDAKNIQDDKKHFDKIFFCF